MNTALQLVLLLVLTWLLVAQLFVVAIPLALYYLLRYDGYELIVLAILLDGYYFSFYEVPLLSIGTLTTVFLINFIKPRLLMYTKDDETFS